MCVVRVPFVKPTLVNLENDSSTKWVKKELDRENQRIWRTEITEKRCLLDKSDYKNFHSNILLFYYHL